MGSPDNNGTPLGSVRNDEYSLNVFTDHVKGPDDTVWVRLVLSIGPLSMGLSLPPNHMDSFITDLAPLLKDAAVQARTITLTD